MKHPILNNIIILLAGLVFGALLLRRNSLTEETAEQIGTSTKTVSATVDGKPVRSYILDKPQ